MYLFVQSTELLLAIVDSKQEAFCALLPILLRMGLPELLTDLIEGEVTGIIEGTSTCGSGSFTLMLFTFSFVKASLRYKLTGVLMQRCCIGYCATNRGGSVAV